MAAPLGFPPEEPLNLSPGDLCAGSYLIERLDTASPLIVETYIALRTATRSLSSPYVFTLETARALAQAYALRSWQT